MAASRIRQASSSTAAVPIFQVARDAESPLHRQVYEGFRAAILRSELGAGQRVPSSRALAEELGISRFPILDAYGLLIEEGYFETRKGAGTFVSSTLPFQQVAAGIPTGQLSGNRLQSRRQQLVPEFHELAWRHGWGAFGVHQPALDHFPFGAWSKLVAQHSRAPRMHAIHHIHPLGIERFRVAIAAYLRTARGVRCDPDQIMIVSGSQQALDITTRVLFDRGDAVWVEEPSYPLARAVLLGAGCRLVPVPVDDEGLDVAAGIKLGRKARAAFVTPSHQYPLGATMSASRRIQLLNWAESSGAWIVEDDYDSEYRYGTMPVSSLQGLDANARVIYIGTFSKVMFASIRLGYVVIPADLVDSFMSVRFAMDIFPSYLYQEALADFMSSGGFSRHVRSMRSLYRERRAVLDSSLKEISGSELRLQGADAGMHGTVMLPAGVNDLELATRAAQQQLWLWPLSPCYYTKPARQGLVLGFGSTPADQIPAAVKRLWDLIQAVVLRKHHTQPSGKRGLPA